MIEIAAFAMTMLSKSDRSLDFVTKSDLARAGGARLLGTTAIAGIIAALSATPVRAHCTWTGAVSYDWFNAGNWSGGVPTGNPNATTSIDYSTSGVVPPNPVVGGPGAQAGSLTVGVNQGGVLTIQN